MNTHIERGEKFLMDCMRLTPNGKPLAHSYCTKTEKWVKPYPEATGYILSYFCDTYGGHLSEVPNFRELIIAADYLCAIQSKEGGFPSFDFKRAYYVFDTVQVIYGLLKMAFFTKADGYFEVVKKGIDFLLLSSAKCDPIRGIPHIFTEGKFMHLNKGFYQEGYAICAKIIEAIPYLITLDVMHYKMPNSPNNSRLAKLMCTLISWASSKVSSLIIETHPYAYFLEGLSGFNKDTLLKAVQGLSLRVHENGYLASFQSNSFAYTSGSAQVGILLHGAGYKKEALKIRNWCRRVQNKHKSGGLFQYANKNCSQNTDVHSEINSWGTKYFLELERLFNE